MCGKIIKLPLENGSFFASKEIPINEIDEKIINEIYPSLDFVNQGEDDLSLEELYELIIASFNKNEITKTVYYDGNVCVDFPEITLIRAQEQLLTNKNIVIKYLNDSSTSYEEDINTLFVFLDMLSRLNAVDFEIYDSSLKSYSKFAIPGVLMGYGQKYNPDIEIDYCIYRENKLVDRISGALEEDFSSLNKLYGLADGVDSVIGMIENSKGEDPILYLPFIYLYLADEEIIEAMTDKGLISLLDYSYWQIFNKLCNHERLKNIKLVVSKNSWESAMKDDWIKLWSGFSKIEDFGCFAPIIRKNISDKLINEKLYIRNDEEGESRKLPNIILYSDTENSFTIRTSIGSHRGIDRVFNRTYDKKMAKKLHTYLKRLYNGDVVFIE